MASAEELIREAYFAFQNISPGATDEKQQRARAKKFATRILRQYPVSIEARQARSILAQLKGEDVSASFVETHSHTNEIPPLTTPADAMEHRPRGEPGDTDWRSLWQLFLRLPLLQKRILMFVLLFIALFTAFTPFVLVFAFLLLAKRTAVKRLLHKILVSLNQKT